MAVTKLKLKLLEKGITQREVSRRSGINESILSLIATGKYLPNLKQREVIADAVNSDPDELFSDSSVTSEIMR
jgi:transcriptional regulator with XRE-family HTH domain